MHVSKNLVIYLLSAISAVQLAAGEYVGGTPHEKPVDLGDDSFNEAIQDLSNHFWFLKFYAPWCGHCKKMAPVLDSVAPVVAGQMAIGKIDCTIHKKICDEHKVKGFPTLKYSLDGQVADYTGGRDEASLVNFAKRMSSPAVQPIRRLEEAKKFAHETADEGIVFLGSGMPDSDLYKIFSKVARKKQASGYFLWLEQMVSPTDDGRDNSYVEKIEAGIIEPRAWEAKKEERTEESLEAWVQDQNVPTIAVVTRSNFSRITRNGRQLLLAVVDMENEQLVASVKKHMLDFILRAPQAFVDKRYYGLFDGKKWQKFLTQFGVRQEDNPQFLILAPFDQPGEKTYWRNETYSTLPEFLEAVETGSIPPRHPQKLKFSDDPVQFVKDKFVQNLPFSMIPIFILVFVIVLLATPSAEDWDQGDEILEDELEEEEEETDESKKEK